MILGDNSPNSNRNFLLSNKILSNKKRIFKGIDSGKLKKLFSGMEIKNLMF